VTRGFAWARPEQIHDPKENQDQVWQCMVDREYGWVPYELCQHRRDLNEAMDFGYFSEPRRNMMFDLNGRTYMIDWSRMVQRNVRSGTERPIRCAKHGEQVDFSEDDWYGSPLEPKYSFSSKLLMELVRSRLLDVERIEIEDLWTSLNSEGFAKVLTAYMGTSAALAVLKEKGGTASERTCSESSPLPAKTITTSPAKTAVAITSGEKGGGGVPIPPPSKSLATTPTGKVPK
jgi:hypothetical protein